MIKYKRDNMASSKKFCSSEYKINMGRAKLFPLPKGRGVLTQGDYCMETSFQGKGTICTPGGAVSVKIQK
jgi:hypothetical protein